MISYHDVVVVEFGRAEKDLHLVRDNCFQNFHSVVAQRIGLDISWIQGLVVVGYTSEAEMACLFDVGDDCAMAEKNRDDIEVTALYHDDSYLLP